MLAVEGLNAVRLHPIEELLLIVSTLVNICRDGGHLIYTFKEDKGGEVDLFNRFVHNRVI